MRSMEGITIGLDLGEKTCRYCAIDLNGQVVSEGGVATTRTAMREKFSGLERCRIALEAGPHSPWVSRLLAESGHEVIVANPRQLKLITESSRNATLWMHKHWRAWRG
jgi:transposase